MPFHFHKMIKIAPGVKLNFNKKSASMSFGGEHVGSTISPSAGAHIRASAYGTGLSYRKKVGGQKKRRVNSGTAEQKRLLHNVWELEDILELLQAEEELDAALDAKMAPIGRNARKEKTQAQEPCRPETSGVVRIDAIVGGTMSALGLGFLGWIFYNQVIVRYAICGLILFRVGGRVWGIIKAETIAEENARHNMKLKNRSSRAENILGSQQLSWVFRVNIIVCDEARGGNAAGLVVGCALHKPKPCVSTRGIFVGCAGAHDHLEV